MSLELSIDNRTFSVASSEELEEHLQSLGLREMAEIWISEPDGPALCLLKNKELALLMFLEEPGDPGSTSRSEALVRSREPVELRLANGQIDEVPAHWLIPCEMAYRALEYFRSHRRPAPFVRWQRED